MNKFLPLLLSVLFIPFCTTTVRGDSWSDLQKDLKEAIRSRQGNRISQALQNLSRDDSRRAAKTLIKVALYADRFARLKLKQEEIANIYQAAQSGVGNLKSSSARSYVFRKIRYGKWPEKIFLMEAIADWEGKDVEKALSSALKSRRRPVVETALTIVKEKDIKGTIPTLIKLWKKYKTKHHAMWMKVRRVLLALTGQDYSNYQDWKNWWDLARQNGMLTQKGSHGRTVLKKRKKKSQVPKFFGTEILSRRLVFVIDTSGSMDYRPRPPERRRRPRGRGFPGPRKTPPVPRSLYNFGGVGPQQQANQKGVLQNKNNNKKYLSRMERAQRELIKVIRQLDSRTYFNIVSFSTRAHVWKRGRLQRATSYNKRRAIRFVNSLGASGGTRTDKAMKKAFSIAGAEDIYLLSDGAPSVPTSEVIHLVENLNRFRKLRVHTLGFPGAHASFMKKLANNNRGSYRHIPGH